MDDGADSVRRHGARDGARRGPRVEGAGIPGAREEALGRFTATIASLTLVRIGRFARIVVVTAVLGTTALGDLYQTANLVPNILFELFAAAQHPGGHGAALVADERDSGAPVLANAVLGWLLATLGATAVALVATPGLMALLTAAEPDARCGPRSRAREPVLAIFLVQLLFCTMGMVATALPSGAPLLRRAGRCAARQQRRGDLRAYLLFAALRGGEAPSLSLSGLLRCWRGHHARRGGVHGRTGRGRGPQRGALASDHSARSRCGPSGSRRCVAGGVSGLTQLLTLGVLVLGNGADGTVARFAFAFAFFQLPYADRRAGGHGPLSAMSSVVLAAPASAWPRWWPTAW